MLLWELRLVLESVPPPSGLAFGNEAEMTSMPLIAAAGIRLAVDSRPTAASSTHQMFILTMEIL